jgi:uncharacterized membrane protein YfcA
MSLTPLLGITVIVGLLLGLLGGGGSILMVPVLVYLAGMEPKTAIATSLVVVGLTSLIAVLSHARDARVCWKNGWVFGLSGMLGAYGGGRLAAYVPGKILLLMFAIVMLGTALTLLAAHRDRSAGTGPPGDAPLCPTRLNLPAVLFDGFLVGAITGLVGVGGGFIIVPALNILGGLPIRAAIGTSLLVIVMNSAAALAGYGSHVHIDPEFTAIITGAAISGSLIGSVLSRRVSSTRLRRSFGLFVIGVAGYLLHRELSWQAITEIRQLVTQHREFFRGVLTAMTVMVLYWFRGMVHQRQPGTPEAGNHDAEVSGKP